MGTTTQEERVSAGTAVLRADRLSLLLDPARMTHRLRFFAFDTDIEIVMRDAAGAARDAADDVVRECRRYELLLSRFLPGSDISRVNAACGKPVRIDRETYGLIETALSYCERSEGTFDITIGAAARLWDFHAGHVPEHDALARACRHIDWRAIRLLGEDEFGGTVRMSDPEASIDLGGIAKGHIADRLSETLVAHGITSHLISLGGNTVARGTRDGNAPWRASIPDPCRPQQNALTVEMDNVSVVTSGTYERSFHRDGMLYHHVLSPKTGCPVRTDLASATVVARRSIDAEGFSTTLLALGCTRALELAQRTPEIETAHLIKNDGALVSAS